MNISEYYLKITYAPGIEKELIYRGNENLVIRSKTTATTEQGNEGEEVTVSIIISRDILTKFLEMLE